MALCIFCGLEFEATGVGEHVVPECAGGSITISEVCRVCNGKLNKNVDEKFCRDFLVQLGRYALDIEGKRKKDKAFPFNGVVETDKGYIARLDENFTPEIISDINIEDLNDGRKISVSIDKYNIDELPKILFRKFKEYYTDKTDEEIRQIVDDAVAEFKAKHDTEKDVIKERPTYKYPKSIDLDLINDEFCKIAYEIVFAELGYDFLNDPQMVMLKHIALGNVDDYILERPPLEIELWALDKDKHHIILANNRCIISVFSVRGMITFSDNSVDGLEDKIIYYGIDPIAKKHNRAELPNTFRQ